MRTPLHRVRTTHATTLTWVASWFSPNRGRCPESLAAPPSCTAPPYGGRQRWKYSPGADSELIALLLRAKFWRLVVQAPHSRCSFKSCPQLQWQGAPVSFSQQADCCDTVRRIQYSFEMVLNRHLASFLFMQKYTIFGNPLFYAARHATDRSGERNEFMS